MDQALPLPAPPAIEVPALPEIRPIPVAELWPWLLFGGLLMLVLVYFVGVEQGALSIFSNSYVHEFVHDGRHLFGFPCH
ncbi:MAG TPA: CbtB domain-containing protein [Dehalococcoidia bacterium]|nr:CbtB domain-containing protein [Dehalococcoidia bacterium]